MSEAHWSDRPSDEQSTAPNPSSWDDDYQPPSEPPPDYGDEPASDYGRDWGTREYEEEHRSTGGKMDRAQPDTAGLRPPSRSRRGFVQALDDVKVFGREPRDSAELQSRGARVLDRVVGKALGETANSGQSTTPQHRPLPPKTNRREPINSWERTPTAGTEGGRSVDAADAGARRQAAADEVQRIEAFLVEIQGRRKAGETVPEARPMGSVFGAFKGSPINQTRIQVLAAAATARHLEGPDSENASKLSQLVEDNAVRLQAIRDEERHRAGIEHERNGTPQAEIDAEEKARTEQEAREDKNVFNAAAAVSLGYVAAQGLPTYEQLADLSEAQLGAVPEEIETAADTDSGSRSGRGVADVLSAAGRGLAQAVGPVVGDDEVAPNLSPVNVAQLNEELASIAASLAPAMKAAMSSHPRSVKEMLNVEQTPDENSAFFESEEELAADLEKQELRAQEQESERDV